MKIDGVAYRSVWVDAEDGWSVHILDQTKLPWAVEILRLSDVHQAAHAIRAMQARGAPLIGALRSGPRDVVRRQVPRMQGLPG